MSPELVVEMIHRQRVTARDQDHEHDHDYVLLVDDEANVTTALARVLRRQGYRVVCADSAEQALRQLALLPRRLTPHRRRALSSCCGASIPCIRTRCVFY